MLVAALSGQQTPDQTPNNALSSAPTAGATNAASLAQDGRTATLLLSLLDEEDFYVRYFTTQLLNSLGINHAHKLQEIILSNPMASYFIYIYIYVKIKR